MAKEKKTLAELKALILADLRKYPECRDVTDVAIYQMTDPTQVNWAYGWVCSGSQMAPATADRIAQEFQARFDLKQA